MVEVEGGINGTHAVLYHHSDGYPKYMVPLLQEAYRQFASPRATGGPKTGYGERRTPAEYRRYSQWSAARAEYAAAMIASVDPTGFNVVGADQIRDGHGEQPDLEYYYVVHVGGNGPNGDPPIKWLLEIRTPDFHGAELLPPTPITRVTLGMIHRREAAAAPMKE
jgi:hypothetical protein